MKMMKLKQILPLASACVVLPLALSAATISGTVTDETTHKVASGDDVVLIALSQRMQEVARTKTDSNGRYSLQPPDDAMHLVRVDHQKAAYFQPAPPGTTKIDVKVYDVAEKVPGVSTEANVFRAETNGQGLRVTQSYFIKNDSNPPMTQFSPRAYEIYLPEGAQIQGAAAMGPGGMPVSSSPIPLGDPNHYAFVFPLRPGETQFQVSYQMPYSGSLKFTPKLATPVDNLVVILPKSMSFKPDTTTGFQSIDPAQSGQELNALTFVAKDVSPTKPIEYTISGSGSLPRDVQAAQNPGAGGPVGGSNAEPNSPEAGSAAAQADTRPGGGLGNPIDSPDPLNKYKWWILSGLGLALAIAAGFLLRRPSPATSASTLPEDAPYVPAGAPSAITGPPTTLAALKEELFSLETDRMQGKLSETEYAELKQALDVLMRRSLAR
jgi:hypothetical protein